MIRLGWRLLPYALVLGGLFLLTATVPALMRGTESAPTSVEVSEVRIDSPDARWLNITNGGLYLPDALIDEQTKRSTGARRVKAWYVPLIPEGEAIERALAMVEGTPRPSTTNLVLVRFDPDEFLKRYPSPNDLTADQVFQPVQVEGLRSSNVLLPQRMKDYVRAELQLPLDSVVVVKFGQKPMQRDQAITMTAIMAVITLIGAVWIVQRFRAPSVASPPPPPQFQA